jgi:hypothetical protein
MWRILLISNIFLATMATNSTNSPRLIKFDAETLNKLRLEPGSLSTAEPYIDYEFVNEYQCAIECVKDQTICTGYVYDAAGKICSLFDIATKSIDAGVTKMVS